MKVSVVVAVYNPGPHIEQLVQSLLRQSLPEDQYEAIFVDDSSTDGTPQLLDDLAAEHEVVRVVHNVPNSGWPGRPRNLGIDAARGEYVYFVDNDDWLEPEALERLYDYAQANASDIVWGRIVGDGRAVPRDIFRRNIPDARLGRDPLLSLLTPHKLFRTTFLRENEIRFPEGRRRLEDHVFVMQAYFAARKISVLADYPCYHWVRRSDEGNASYERLDPDVYFGNVREVLDIVEGNTEPGPFRDKLLAHWFGGKTVIWLEGRSMLAYPDDYRVELFDTIRALVRDRFPDRLDRYIAPRRRVIALLVRAGDLDAVLTWVRWTTGVRARASVAVAAENGRLRLRVSCVFEDADGLSLSVRHVDGRDVWQVPDSLALPDLPSAALDVSGSLPRARVDAFVRNRKTWVIDYVPVDGLVRPRMSEDGVAVLQSTVDVVIDPAVVTNRRFGPVGDVVVRFTAAGWSLETRPRLENAAAMDSLDVRSAGSRLVPYGTEGYGNLSLRWAPVRDASATSLPRSVGNRPGHGRPSLGVRLVGKLDRGLARLARSK